MADGHFPDVELLRRELAALILEWAGKAVKDDPDGPLSTALTRAVSEAARTAVAEQHQIAAADAADKIAEALERRGKTGGFPGRASPLGLGLIAVAAVALLAIGFLLGLETGRKEVTLPPAAAAAPIAPLAPTAPTTDNPPAAPATTPVSPPQQPPAQRAERAPARPASRPPPPPSPPRELGRPASATQDAAPRSTQPVGAAATAPAVPTPAAAP